MQQKTFFAHRPQSSISKLPLGVATSSLEQLVNELAEFPKDYKAIFEGSIIPPQFSCANKFKKHARTVRLRRYRSDQEARQDQKTPVLLREEAFNAIKDPFFCGYSYKARGLDQRTVIVSLDQCVAGALLYIYDARLGNQDITFYAQSKRVEREGCDVVVSIPSRRKKHPRYTISFHQVPFSDTEQKYALWQKMRWDHTNEHQRYRELRKKFSWQKECSTYIPATAQPIAAYLKIINAAVNEQKNIVPLQMNPFAIPTQRTVDVYLKMYNNLLIRDEGGLRKPNQAESEIILWELVRQQGHDKTFYAKKKLVEYEV
ncbi:hypothetical protein D6774_03785 [Candidatus Woesearchaeota archaeon]|nr:MAG: hypothetical protein D6774_03785 [Candidatus Woesearchaeota archaeon]